MSGTKAAIVDALRRKIAIQSKGRLVPEAVDPEADVCARGYLDSLSYAEFLLHVETTWGVHVEDAEFVSRFNTLAALADHIERAHSGAAA